MDQSMAFTLVASRVKADKRNQMGVGTISLLAHVGIIAAVVYATAQAGGGVATVKTDTSMVFLAQPQAATPPRSRSSTRPSRASRHSTSRRSSPR